jgi:hypothetical protein
VVSDTGPGFAAASKYMYGVIGVAVVLFCGFWMIRKRQPVFGYLAIWAFLSLLVFLAADSFLWINPIQRLYASLMFNDEAGTRFLDLTSYGWIKIDEINLKSLDYHVHSSSSHNVEEVSSNNWSSPCFAMAAKRSSQP